MSEYKYENDEIAKLLKTVADEFYNEDIETRQIQIRYWQRLKYYWNNFSQVFWSDVDNSFRVWNSGEVGSGTTDQAYYDKPVNVFKAFLETIVAALSIQIPAVSCVPDDATNPLDLETAKAGDKISELLYKHNNVILLWLQALYVYCTEGMIACYTYEYESEEFGTYKTEKYKNEKEEGYFCPECKTLLDDEMFSISKEIDSQVRDEFDPKEEETELLGQKELVCPACATALDPEMPKITLSIPRFDGHTENPKSRICMEVYGGLYVKVANYAKSQAGTPYLIFMYDTHYANVLEEYQHLSGKLPRGAQNSVDPTEQYARLNVQYRGTYPQNNVTVKKCWLRPAAFNVLEDEKRDKLKEKFPEGAKIVLVNDCIADYCAEKLDDHWTLTQNPTSDYLTHEPLGEVLVNVQDIVNDLISLTIQTIEHGIPQTWVDPAFVDTDSYGQMEVIPGALTPTKTVSSGRNISEGFHSTTTAALNPEVFSFYKIVQELGQFVSGALPSLFGGAQTTGSNTASEYAMSKGMALQRLQTPWKMLTVWWKGIFGKVIPMYMKMLADKGYDERMVMKDKQGNFINVFINRAELGGSIGSVELEASEQLPISDDQQKEIVLQLMQLNNAEVFRSLAAPENLPYIKKLVRIPQFKLPGEDDRTKQYEEIAQLITEQPYFEPPDEMMNMESIYAGMGPIPPAEVSSVPIDPIVDNHQIEADICRSWLVSLAGRNAKIENEAGYRNVLLHMKAHLDELNAQMEVMQMNNTLAQEAQKPNSPGKNPSGGEKVKDETNVNAPVQ